MIKQLLSRTLTDHHIGNLSEEPFDPEPLKAAYQENHDAFLDEYQKSYCHLKESIGGDHCSETVVHSLTLLRFIEINMLLKLDPQMLADAFVCLANMIQQLQTVYATETYEGCWGTVIAFKMNGRVCELLRRGNDESREFVEHAVSQMPITNTNLALWNHCALKHYGVRVSRKVTSALNAMYLYDSLLGSGIRDLLLQKPKESVEKKLKTFDSVGLHELTERILAYYSCKTGNEKKRFFSDIENYMGDFNMIEAANRFLSEN